MAIDAWAEAERALEAGVGIKEVLTYPSSPYLQEAADALKLCSTLLIQSANWLMLPNEQLLINALMMKSCKRMPE